MSPAAEYAEYVPARSSSVARRRIACQALSDPTRILILYELRDGARNIGELAEAFEMSQPSVSRHLKVLRDRRMVRADRSGMNIDDRLADQRVIQALDMLREVLAQTLDDHQSLIHEVI